MMKGQARGVKEQYEEDGKREIVIEDLRIASVSQPPDASAAEVHCGSNSTTEQLGNSFHRIDTLHKQGRHRAVEEMLLITQLSSRYIPFCCL